MYFFSSSKRWILLTNKLKKTKNTYILKPHSETLWSSNANAVKALRNGYNIILSVLNNIFENENEKHQFKVENNNLLKKLKKKILLFSLVFGALFLAGLMIVVLLSTTRNFSNIIPIY